MQKKEIIKRYILFIISLFFIALGVAVTKKSELGISPISSIPNVMSLKFTKLTLGNWLTIFNFILLIGQILILRKNFKPVDLLQAPLSFLFGYFTDFGSWLVSRVDSEAYIVRISLVILGTVVLGFGIALSVIANVIMNSGEAFVRAVSIATKKDFPNIKVILDVSYVAISIVLSLIFFDMKVVGAREGTIIAAFCTGFVVKFFRGILKDKLNKVLVR